MNAFQIALLLYAVVIAAGGVMGYVSAQSMVSLVNGLIAAVLLLVGLAISFKNPTAGFGLSAVVALALGVFFAYRFFTRASGCAAASDDFERGRVRSDGVSSVAQALSAAGILTRCLNPPAYEHPRGDLRVDAGARHPLYLR